MGDVYDSIVVWTTFEDYSVAAYYQPLRNDTRGLGVCDPNATTQDALFGCQFDRTNGARLQGVIYMNSVGLWRSIDQQWGLNFGLDDFQSQTYAVLGQESAHRWLVGFHFRDGRTGRGSTELLGRDFSHWNIKADTAASVMDGLDWVDNNDGTFTAVGDNDGYSQLDLYGMGLLAKEEVEPLFIVEGAHSERLKAVYRQFQQNITGDLPDGTDGLPAGVPPIEYMGPMPATGTRVDVDIDMVVAMSGERIPSYADSQKAFNQAFVLVTLPGQTAGAAANEVDELEVVRRTWEMFFAQKTLGRGTMCTALSGTCAPSVAEIVDIRWSDAANNPSDGEWGRGEETDVYLTLKNGGGAPIESVGATLSTSGTDVTITTGNVVFGTLSGGSRVESPTAFRVKLGARVSCDTHSVPVTVSIDGGGQAQEFQLVVKACGGSEQPEADAPATKKGPFQGVGPCACATTQDSVAPWALLGMFALLVARRRR
jgi:MYXO-CTERM domain-containing protein